MNNHSITTSSDLIKQLQPILLHPELNYDSSALDEDITNTKLLKSKANNTISLKTSLIIEYILTYMQKQPNKSLDNEDIGMSTFNTNIIEQTLEEDIEDDDASSMGNENDDTFNIVSELDNDINNPSKLKKMLILLAKTIKQISEDLENRNNLIHMKTPNTSRHSNLALLDNLNDKDVVMEDTSSYDKLFSFLISECVVNNVTLKSTQNNNENEYTMLENSIKELIQRISTNQNDNNVNDKGMVNSTVTDDDDLKLKLEDLQLAHDFLSQKFSKERLHYNNDITIKEKQISNVNKQLKEKNLEIKRLNEVIEELKASKGNNSKPITPYNDDHENFNYIINSPSSISSNNSETINVLKTEFKSQLNKMRDHYEMELEKLRK